MGARVEAPRCPLCEQIGTDGTKLFQSSVPTLFVKILKWSLSNTNIYFSRALNLKKPCWKRGGGGEDWLNPGVTLNPASVLHLNFSLHALGPELEGNKWRNSQLFLWSEAGREWVELKTTSRLCTLKRNFGHFPPTCTENGSMCAFRSRRYFPFCCCFI